MKIPNHRADGHLNVTALEDRLPSRPDAYAKCLPGFGATDDLGCGATLLTELDWLLHRCDFRATSKLARRGNREDRVVLM